MWNDRTLDADIEYAAEMVREGLATVERAAQACGIPLPALQSHLAGVAPKTGKTSNDTSGALKGSISGSDLQRKAEVAPLGHAEAIDAVDEEGGEGPVVEETTDYFVFYREEDLWLWKRVDRDGTIVSTCDERFEFYLDCVAGARPHGFHGRPLFIFAASDIASFNAPDKQG